MTALEQIKKLEEQKQKLLVEAKKEALEKAEAAVKELNELGFHYKLVSSDRTTTVRRSGVRADILAEIQKHPNGIDRQALMEAVGITDEKGRQSLSNAVAALKKAGKITGEGGHYTAIL